MISGATACFPNNPQGYQMHDGMMMDTDNIISFNLEAASCVVDSHSQTLLYNLSLLKEKVQQMQSLVSAVLSADQIVYKSTAVANAGTIVQEIIITASSMLYAFQQASYSDLPHDHEGISLSQQPSNGAMDQVLHSFEVDSSNTTSIIEEDHKKPERPQDFSLECDIIELDAADLLAKYTHYCQVCGKGFKRDANLRMHMRAHGDEYKTNAALSNPVRSGSGPAVGQTEDAARRKYSCPQEGCRWNQRHAKFQPLKSMVCAKNHYRRSHCPKMYVCNRCGRKQFAVLSDLRTHEKHCGDLRWRCSCGTTFSRKDKLMGHVALFDGHSPVVAVSPLPKQGGQEGINGLQDWAACMGGE